MIRLHENGFVQQSVSDRNLLVQPGPLSAAPDKRSLKTPSFRLIDFGRGMFRDNKDFNKEFFSKSSPTMVDGHPAQVVDTYNRMISDSNNLRY